MSLESKWMNVSTKSFSTRGVPVDLWRYFSEAKPVEVAGRGRNSPKMDALEAQIFNLQLQVVVLFGGKSTLGNTVAFFWREENRTEDGRTDGRTESWTDGGRTNGRT